MKIKWAKNYDPIIKVKFVVTTIIKRYLIISISCNKVPIL